MKYILYILLLFCVPAVSLAQQARVNITSGYMQIGAVNNGTASTKTYLVLDDSSSTALKASAGSGVLSSGEFNMVEWNIGRSAVGTVYTLPWISDDLVAIPLVVTISTAGVNNQTGTHQNASVSFSTWHTIADQYNGSTSITGLPSDCINFDAGGSPVYASPSPTDDSYNVVDRFWIVDATSSAGKAYKANTAPGMSMVFQYLGSGDGVNSEVSSPNILVDGSLLAQRYNSTLNEWGDYTPTTTGDVAGGSAGTLTMSAVAPSQFFRDWTLSSIISPLPIKLLDFTAQCQNYYAVLQWATATESNNDYFTVERTDDGVNYQTVAVIKGAGNSSSTLNYSATDYSPLPGTSYYRLSQTDMDGHTTVAGTVVFNHCESSDNTSINAYGVNNYITVQINSIENYNEDYTVSLSNVLGQTIFSQTKNIVKGFNEFRLYPNVAQGAYFIAITNSATSYHKKILIKE